MRRAALLLFVVAGVFATAATATAPPVVTHTYKVKYILKGHFHEVLSYTEADGYCNGTGYVEDADFAVAAGTTIKVKLQSPFAAGTAALPNIEPGSWKLTGQVVPDGAECSERHQEACSGDLKWVGTPTAHLFVVGKGHSMAFSLTTPTPREGLKGSDCGASSGDNGPPPPENSIQRALAPYSTVGLVVPIATLGARTVVSGTAKPVNVPGTYSLATCDHEATCHAVITGFSSKITVTRVR